MAAEIDAASIPVHEQAVEAERAGWVTSALDLVLHGGEDYERVDRAKQDTRARGRVAIEECGNAQVFEPRGWEHLQEGSY